MGRLGSLLALAVALILPACAHAQSGSALLQNPAHQVTITDHVHGTMMFAPSIFLSPNSPGILNTTPGQPLILQKGVATTGTDAGDFRFDRNANYAGGTHGFVNPVLYGNCAVSAGAISFEWCGLFRMDNSSSAADAAENVAVYAQSHKRNGGATWALVAELQDHNANPTTPSVTLEFDLQTKGTDTNNARVIQDLWGKTDDGLATVIGNGMRFNTDASTTLTNGLTFQGANISNAAVGIGSGQKLCLDGITCANHWSQTGGVATLTTAGSASNVFSAFGLQTVAVNASAQITTTSGQKICLDGTACTYYWTQSGGTTTYNTPTGAVLNVSSGGAVSAFSDLGSFGGNITLASGKKLCLDGLTCANYLSQSGGTITIGATAGGGGASTITGSAATLGNVSALSLTSAGGVSGTTGTFSGAVSGTTITGSSTVQGASLVASGGNASVPAGNRLCLNGTTCTYYIVLNGTAIEFHNPSGTPFQISSTGLVNAAAGYQQFANVGVSCTGAPTALFASSLGIVTHC